MRRRVPLAVLAVVMLGTGACGSGSDEKGEKGEGSVAAPSDAPDDSACKELLGDAGLKWLKDRTGAKARLKAEDDLKSARALFYRQVENWGPEDSGVPTFLESDVCSARTDVENSQKELALRYGASTFPFDFRFDEKSDVGPAQTVTPVNSDVRLVHGKDADGKAAYRVYVKCKIPGTPAKQENEIPIEGLMSDTLTGESSPRVRLTHLLNSAKVMAETFDCQNKPVVPAEPPASVT
ncbi:hypothetical protein AB0M39_13475 [Streptomyces sp. NPDC051907]|uniref:hypothetical protein n=1 Tax=Streptomyces sp. NPDC051907 TaxID=3155284 RepID=UPI0034446AAE